MVRAVGDPRSACVRTGCGRCGRSASPARLGFSLDAATWDAIVESAPHMGRLSAERVKQEIEKTLEQVARPSASLELWRRSGAMRVLVPALDAVPVGAFAVVDHLPMPRLAAGRTGRSMRLAGLFGAAGAKAAREAMTALRFSRAESGTVTAVVERADALQPLIEAAIARGRWRPLPDRQVRQWVAAAGGSNAGSSCACWPPGGASSVSAGGAAAPDVDDGTRRLYAGPCSAAPFATRWSWRTLRSTATTSAAAASRRGPHWVRFSTHCWRASSRIPR